MGLHLLDLPEEVLYEILSLAAYPLQITAHWRDSLTGLHSYFCVCKRLRDVAFATRWLGIQLWLPMTREEAYILSSESAWISCIRRGIKLIDLFLIGQINHQAVAAEAPVEWCIRKAFQHFRHVETFYISIRGDPLRTSTVFEQLPQLSKATRLHLGLYHRVEKNIFAELALHPNLRSLYLGGKSLTLLDDFNGTFPSIRRLALSGAVLNRFKTYQNVFPNLTEIRLICFEDHPVWCQPPPDFFQNISLVEIPVETLNAAIVSEILSAASTIQHLCLNFREFDPDMYPYLELGEDGFYPDDRPVDWFHFLSTLPQQIVSLECGMVMPESRERAPITLALLQILNVSSWLPQLVSLTLWDSRRLRLEGVYIEDELARACNKRGCRFIFPRW